MRLECFRRSFNNDEFMLCSSDGKMSRDGYDDIEYGVGVV